MPAQMTGMMVVILPWANTAKLLDKNCCLARSFRFCCSSLVGEPEEFREDESRLASRSSGESDEDKRDGVQGGDSSSVSIVCAVRDDSVLLAGDAFVAFSCDEPHFPLFDAVGIGGDGGVGDCCAG